MDFLLILILLFGYVGNKAEKKFTVGKKILLTTKKNKGEKANKTNECRFS